MSFGVSQPVLGAKPPSVFNRWMNVVPDSVSPPFGPSCAPTTCNLTQGIAVDLTVATAIAFAQTVLVSWESSQVTRTTPPSSGLGLAKWVMSCSRSSLNNVAWGVNNVQSTRPKEAAGWQMVFLSP